MIAPESEGLTDEVLKEEIELVGAIVVAASESSEHMRDIDIDRLLGVAGDEADGDGVSNR